VNRARLDDLLAHAHGFTAVWYRPQRLAVIAAAVTRPGGGTR
jgi:hypothetical protein